MAAQIRSSRRRTVQGSLDHHPRQRAAEILAAVRGCGCGPPLWWPQHPPCKTRNAELNHASRGLRPRCRADIPVRRCGRPPGRQSRCNPGLESPGNRPVGKPTPHSIPRISPVMATSGWALRVPAPHAQCAADLQSAVLNPPHAACHVRGSMPLPLRGDSPIQRTAHPQARPRHHMRINLRRPHILVPQ
jgi:hypothetical protein